MRAPRAVPMEGMPSLIPPLSLTLGLIPMTGFQPASPQAEVASFRTVPSPRTPLERLVEGMGFDKNDLKYTDEAPAKKRASPRKKSPTPPAVEAEEVVTTVAEVAPKKKRASPRKKTPVVEPVVEVAPVEPVVEVAPVVEEPPKKKRVSRKKVVEAEPGAPVIPEKPKRRSQKKAEGEEAEKPKRRSQKKAIEPVISSSPIRPPSPIRVAVPQAQTQALPVVTSEQVKSAWSAVQVPDDITALTPATPIVLPKAIARPAPRRAQVLADDAPTEEPGLLPAVLQAMRVGKVDTLPALLQLLENSKNRAVKKKDAPPVLDETAVKEIAGLLKLKKTGTKKDVIDTIINYLNSL